LSSFGLAKPCREIWMLDAKLCRLGVLIIIAGRPRQPDRVANDGPDLQCHHEETIGTMITNSVCTTGAERAEQQAQFGEVRRAAEASAGSPTRSANQSPH
jgi:hypothetical protein